MELQRAIDSLLKWMHRYVSPVFLALLMASFILWYIAKLSYIYTTEQKVRVPPRPEAFYYGMMQLQRKVKIEKFFGGVNRKEKKPDYIKNEE